jgi:hypothetical protein
MYRQLASKRYDSRDNKGPIPEIISREVKDDEEGCIFDSDWIDVGEPELFAGTIRLSNLSRFGSI